MNISNSEISKHVNRLAGRLRLLQADFADDNTEIREQFLADEIERALADIMPEDKGIFFQELQALFPTWDRVVDISPGATESASRSKSDMKELEDPSFLVSRLIELAPRLNDMERDALIDRLRTVGLAPPAKGPWPESSTVTARARLNIPDKTNLDPARLLDLFTLLTEFCLSLDQLVWKTWRLVSPNSTFRRTGELNSTLGRYVSGSEEVPRGQVSHDLEKLRSLIAALIASISHAGQPFAQHYCRKYAPAEVEAYARPEKKFMETLEVACWRKYCELAEALEESSIEREIMQSIANYAESLIKGLKR